MFPFNFSSLLLFPGSLIFCSPFCSLVFLLLFYLCSDLFSIPCFFYLLIFSPFLFCSLFSSISPLPFPLFLFFPFFPLFPPFPLFSSLLSSSLCLFSHLFLPFLLSSPTFMSFASLFSSLLFSLPMSSLPFPSLLYLGTPCSIQ